MAVWVARGRQGSKKCAITTRSFLTRYCVSADFQTKLDQGQSYTYVISEDAMPPPWLLSMQPGCPGGANVPITVIFRVIPPSRTRPRQAISRKLYVRPVSVRDQRLAGLLYGRWIVGRRLGASARDAYDKARRARRAIRALDAACQIAVVKFVPRHSHLL